MSLLVITLVKNDFDNFAKTRDSILSQDSIPNWLIIDSSDSAMDLPEFDAPNTKKFFVEPIGIYPSMNFAIARARENYDEDDFILFLNSGDIFTDSKAVSTIKSVKDQDVIYWNYIVLDNLTGLHKIVKPSNWSINNQLFANNPIHHQALVVKLKHFKEVEPFDTSLKCASDWNFICEISKNLKFFYHEQVLTQFELGGFSSLNRKLGNRELYNLRKIYLKNSPILAVRSLIFLKYREFRNYCLESVLYRHLNLLKIVRMTLQWRKSN